MKNPSMVNVTPLASGFFPFSFVSFLFFFFAESSALAKMQHHLQLPLTSSYLVHIKRKRDRGKQAPFLASHFCPPKMQPSNSGLRIFFLLFFSLFFFSHRAQKSLKRHAGSAR